jgi:hypothetical protein
LAKYEMEDPRVLAIVVSLMGWELKGVGEGFAQEFPNPALDFRGL